MWQGEGEDILISQAWSHGLQEPGLPHTWRMVSLQQGAEVPAKQYAHCPAGGEM